MNAVGLQQMERSIARCRVVLSVAAILVVYIDPGEPLLGRWIEIASGSFMIDPRLFLVMAAHTIYSITVYAGMGRIPSARVATLTTWVDVVFGVVIGAMTQGVTGPSYPFFTFAVVATALRGGLRQVAVVTMVSLLLYVGLCLIENEGGADVYIMRPVYLAITGYVVGYLGQQRIELQEQMRQLEIAEQRHRIARDLHDGYAQALAGIDLRLEGSRRLLRGNATAEALSELTDLQESVKREFDDLRRYARTLAGVEVTPTARDGDGLTRLALRADLAGSVALVEHVLGIVREGISNLRRHAHARTASIEIRTDDTDVSIRIEDDGVGFGEDVTPWSIASRVREIGGRIEVTSPPRSGAHLLITLPQA